MTNFGHKIMLTVLVLLITPPLGFAAATVNASPLTQTSKVTVKGVVKDAAGAPLLGVTVIVKGTSVGTSTSIDGETRSSAPPMPNSTSRSSATRRRRFRWPTARC